MIEQLANEQKVACILIDHEVRPKLVNAVLKPSIKRVAIDILAANSTSIIGYITQLQQAILSCGKV
jgi:ABC-type Zn2+ transport system substrate-binding protein/surface adhesin